MPNATNVVPEQIKVGLEKESTWGTDPAGTPILIPVDAPDLKEEVAHIADEGLRGLFARDFEGYGGLRQVTGSLGGIFYGTSDAAETSLASPVAHILAALLGGTAATQIGATNDYIHDFYTTELPGSLTLTVEDSLTAAQTTPHYVGVMFPRLTLRYNGGEGLLTWEADILGLRQQWPNSAGSIAADKTGQAFIGWQSSVHFGTAAANPTALAKVISAEIVIERELMLVSGASNQQYAQNRAARPPRVTFTAVVEFVDYADYKLYSDDTNDHSSNQQAWTFRFCNKAAVHTQTGDSSLSLAAGDAVLDIRLHTVSYGESALTISRGEAPNTMEFAGRSLYTPSPTWFGATPPTAARTGQSLIQIRLINQRTSAY